MRIAGQTPQTRFHQIVQLPRPQGTGPTLVLSPLPLGFQRRLRGQGLRPPVAPTRVARDPQGRALRQANGQAAVIVDEQDPDYLQSYELYHQRVAVLSIVEALRHDPEVEFDTRAEDFPDDWPSYADQVYAELEAAGWTAGDLVWLCTHICQLSNLLEAHLEETAADFSSAAGAGLSPHVSSNRAP